MFSSSEGIAETVAGEALGRIVRHARAARRLRLEVPGLLGDELLARRIEHAVSAQQGVETVHADARSGRVLITYAEGAPIFNRLAALTGAPGKGAVGASTEGTPATAAAESTSPAAPVQKAAPTDGNLHALPAGAVLNRLHSSYAGLGAAEAARRLRKHGRNQLEQAAGHAWYRILGRQVANLPTGLLLGATAASLVLGDVLEAGAIVLVLSLNTAIGYAVERRSEGLLASWRALEARSARVVRDARVAVVSAAELVPGDVLLCQAGDVVPADARVIEADRLSCDEAALTGESEPRRKGVDAVAADALLADRTSMLFSGTAVASGRGRAVVTATARRTEVARIRSLLEETAAPKAPIERQLDILSRRASAFALGAAGLSALAGIARGRPALTMVRNAVALGVAAIPEGLPLVATTALVSAMNRLRGSGVIVRRVAAAEALGSVTVVCADKTGTLTRNEMCLELVDWGAGAREASAVRVAPGDPLRDPVSRLLAGAVLNSDVEVRTEGSRLSVLGSSTEEALVRGARRAGLDVLALRRAFPRRVLREREEGIHYVKSLHDAPTGGQVAFVKGAPEQVVELADASSAELRAAILTQNRVLALRGLRVLALAWQPVAGSGDAVPSRGYQLAGLLALGDPLRDTAADTIRRAREAGIRTVILTGDQSETAAAIARQLGLEGDVLEGAEVARLLAKDGPVLRERLSRVAVFSRVTPSDKLAIVRALRATGEVVAMVGDGVNDAPALKAADVGVAVSRGSTDLARQTADVVLDSEDLDPLVHAVAEGRILRDNLARTVRFLFATNLSEIALVLGGSLLGAEPLNALQLLWVNLLTDTLPALALALAPGDRDVLARPPAAPGSALLDGPHWRQVVRDGLLLGGLGGLGFLAGGPAAAFATLPAAQLGYAAACRAPASAAPPDTGGGRFPILPVVGGSLALHAAVLLLPPLRAALRIPSLTPAAALGLSAVALPWMLARRLS